MTKEIIFHSESFIEMWCMFIFFSTSCFRCIW